MSLTTYGYNGFFSLRKRIVDRLVDDFYERSTAAHLPLVAHTGKNGINKYWEGTYTNLHEALGANNATVSKATADVDEAICVWTGTEESGYAKFLVEPIAGENNVILSWIRYTPRVKPSARIVKSVTSTFIKTVTVAGHAFRCYRFDGTMRLQTRKVKRSLITRQAGLEKWFWIRKTPSPPPQQATPIDLDPDVKYMPEPGVDVRWELKKDQLVYRLDKSDELVTYSWPHEIILPEIPGLQQRPRVQRWFIYDVEWKGEDAFGVQLEACTVALATPWEDESTTSSNPPFKIPPEDLLGLLEGGPKVAFPCGGPNPSPVLAVPLSKFPQSQVTLLVAQTLSNHMALDSTMERLADALTEALQSGHSSLNSGMAEAIIAAMQAGTGPGRCE